MKVFLHIPPVMDIFTWPPVLILSSEKLDYTFQKMGVQSKINLQTLPDNYG